MEMATSLGRKPLLSVEEVAILLGQSRSSVYRSIERRDLPLPIFKLNGRWRVPRRAVERLLDGDLLMPTSTLQSAEPTRPAVQ
jgi:excisionase family DNA binding protein